MYVTCVIRHAPIQAPIRRKKRRERGSARTSARERRCSCGGRGGSREGAGRRARARVSIRVRASTRTRIRTRAWVGVGVVGRGRTVAPPLPPPCPRRPTPLSVLVRVSWTRLVPVPLCWGQRPPPPHLLRLPPIVTEEQMQGKMNRKMRGGWTNSCLLTSFTALHPSPLSIVRNESRPTTAISSSIAISIITILPV